MEATTGIEPGFTDLQSAASPLRHVASKSENRGRGLYQNLAPGDNGRARGEQVEAVETSGLPAGPVSGRILNSSLILGQIKGILTLAGHDGLVFP